MSPMEVVVAVMKPKQSVSSFFSKEFHPGNYSIMLVESKAPVHAEWGKPIRSLPMFPIKRDEEPREVILNYLYRMTGDKSGGIKGERALLVRTNRDTRLGYQDNYSTMRLYCVPLSHNHSSNIEKSVTANMAFFSLDTVLEGGKNFTCTPTTLTLLFTLKNWLAEKHLQSGGVRCMFRIRAEYRISVCINNPVFIPRIKEQSSADSRNTANFDALTKMLAIEKCDTVVMNPLFGSGLPYKAKTNRVVLNIYWGMGVPDYNQIIAYHQSAMESKLGMNQVWARNFPIHKCAYEGDVAGINIRLGQFSHSMKDDKMFSPIHYAAWKGHVDVVVTLLKAGCSPNITNNDLQTPLHIAALRGKPHVVHVLLEDSDIDVNPYDQNNKTPYDLCFKETNPEVQQAAALLKAAMNRPSRKIEVHLMDGEQKTLNLTTGDNTTVSHFKEQMLRELDMPETFGNIFSIWICSQSLELQLRLDHKPVNQLHTWKNVVKQLTEGNPEQEKPILQWRRNAKVNLQEEQQLITQVQHEVSINLLFQEAYHNYINGLYPFTDQTNFSLAASLMYITCGKQDTNSARTYCTKNFSKFMPALRLRTRGTNCVKEVLTQYRLLLEDDTLTTLFLKLQFLKKCHTLQVYGSAFFFGTLQERANRHILYHIGVNGFGIHLINCNSKAHIKSYMYDDISWCHPKEYNINLLEIRLENSARTTIHLHTKQAGTICHLMTKLSHK